MTKQTISKITLESYLLTQIQAVPRMKTVSDVHVYRLADEAGRANWSVAWFNPGEADVEAVATALRPIVGHAMKTWDLAD